MDFIIVKINDEILDTILSFLAPIQLITLSKTCKKFRKLFTHKYILNKFRCNLDELVRKAGFTEISKQTDREAGYTSVLKPRKCILSGSIVLQAILGEEWIGSDIDMYVTTKDIVRVRHKLFRKMNYFFGIWPRNDLINKSSSTFSPSCFYLLSISGTVLKSVELWESSEPKDVKWQTARDELSNQINHPFNMPEGRTRNSSGCLQVMLLKDDITNAEEGITAFDLDIVKNIWDGVTLSINNLESIATRRAIGSEYVNDMADAFGNVNDSTSDKFFRLKELEEEKEYFKLVRKNYSRWSTNLYKEGIKIVYQVLFSRLHKYSQRGFKIVLNNKEWSRHKLQEIYQYVNNLEDVSDTESESDMIVDIW